MKNFPVVLILLYGFRMGTAVPAFIAFVTSVLDISQILGT